MSSLRSSTTRQSPSSPVPGKCAKAHYVENTPVFAHPSGPPTLLLHEPSSNAMRRNVDVNGLIAKLGAKAPAMFQKVRPTQMLIAQGVSMEITFSGDAKTAFDKDYRKTVQGGGGVSIFGFRIGASGSSSEENASHGNTWDASSGVLTINAENSRASANVLAVMGEIVSA